MNRAPRIERLEDRMLLAGAEPTACEQYLLELINLARLDPVVEAAKQGVDLNAGLAAGTISTHPKQPLAFSPALVAAARGHSEWMLATNTFDHTGQGGSSSADRLTAAGYNFTGAWGCAENIAAEYCFGIIGTTAMVHTNLFLSPAHRVNMMNGSYREAGMGLAQGAFAPNGFSWNALLATEDFAYSSGGVFLTGVVYDDRLGLNDQFYTPGEGLGGVTIEATRKSDNAVFSTTTWTSGGYTLPLAAGVYTVVATGGSLGNSRVVNSNVQMGSQNVKVDFLPTQAVAPASTIDLSIVRTPSATDSLGEVASLPMSEAWIDEWDTCYIEIWAGTPESDNVGVMSALVDVAYNTACFTATSIEFGPAFTSNKTGTIDDVAGVVRNLGAATLLTNVGDDQHVLLARVKLESVSSNDAAGLTIATDAYPAACECGISVSAGQATLVGGNEAEVIHGETPQTELWPVMYDLDDDGEIGLGDLSYFAATYGRETNDHAVAYTQASDFDHDGEVALGDLSYFASAYHRMHGDPEPIRYSDSFPDAWRQAMEGSKLFNSLETSSDLASAFRLAAGVGTEEAIAAHDAVLIEACSPWQVEQAAAQRLAWLYTRVRRQAREQGNQILDNKALAVDLLLAN